MIPVFELQNVSLQFSEVNTPILNKINFTIQAGDHVVVLGSNGSGKSSLLKLLDKRYQTSTGKLLFDGKNLADHDAVQFSKQIKTLTQNCHESLFISLTIFENYLIIKYQNSKRLSTYNLKEERRFFSTYLLKFNPNLADKLDQTVDKLSGGEKQALALALIFIHPPRVLLLDEHTSALDPKTAQNLMALTHAIAQEYNITYLLTTHDLSIAEKYGNRILALKNGEISQLIEYSDKMTFNKETLLAACY